MLIKYVTWLAYNKHAKVISNYYIWHSTVWLLLLIVLIFIINSPVLGFRTPEFPAQGVIVCILNQLDISSSQLFTHVWLFATPLTAARQASLSISNSQNLLKLMSIESVMPFNRLILCRPFSSCLQSFSTSGSFPMSQFFASGGQSIGASASASVLPMNIQDWFRLGWTGLISLQSKGLSRVFSNTTVQKHQFFSAQLSLWSNSHIHTWPLEKP